MLRYQPSCVFLLPVWILPCGQLMNRLVRTCGKMCLPEDCRFGMSLVVREGWGWARGGVARWYVCRALAHPLRLRPWRYFFTFSVSGATEVRRNHFKRNQSSPQCSEVLASYLQAQTHLHICHRIFTDVSVYIINPVSNPFHAG